MQAGVDVVSIDTAHGHSHGVIEVASDVKKKFTDLNLIVGNALQIALPPIDQNGFRLKEESDRDC